MSIDDRWGHIFEILTNPYRRQLLIALLEHNPQDDDDVDPLNTLAEEDEIDDLNATQAQLVHNHLPKLAEKGFIEWDRETGKISTGPNWDDIAPLLELIHDHQDELPEGWL